MTLLWNFKTDTRTVEIASMRLPDGFQARIEHVRSTFRAKGRKPSHGERIVVHVSDPDDGLGEIKLDGEFGSIEEAKKAASAAHADWLKACGKKLLDPGRTPG